MDHRRKESEAATFIQASYRGYKVRKRLQEALRASKLIDEDEFEYKEAECLGLDTVLFNMDDCMSKQVFPPPDSQEENNFRQDIPRQSASNFYKEPFDQSQEGTTPSAVTVENSPERQVLTTLQAESAPACQNKELRASDR